ncbi:hypothetical protein HQN89_23130 [Paenibacillus frigoriresistens]|uniref:hypothetical protein n=1 Tax=Paenibacillus alginolyticus TaxID=59839 RepID=UPI0015634E64|nr:hypothetical protein [Paenibacillus frigoriresistens]NRF93835.1 hypothetical protein [Paenibacillus frigoriresistens]
MKHISIIVMLCFGLVLSACSSSSQSGPKDSGTGEPQDLVMALGSEPVSLDPQDVQESVSDQVLQAELSSLV